MAGIDSFHILFLQILSTNINQIFFGELKAKGIFTGTELEVLAIQALFMPLIREEIFNFVDSWNNHKIRKQRNRMNHPTGRPFMLYFHPPDGVENFGYTVARPHLGRSKSI